MNKCNHQKSIKLLTTVGELIVCEHCKLVLNQNEIDKTTITKTATAYNTLDKQFMRVYMGDRQYVGLFPTK